MASDVRPGALFEDPDLFAFLPLLYVAWADGELAPGEIRAIHSRLNGAAAGTGSPRQEVLGRWLDPDRPPTATEFQELLGVVRRAAGPLPRADRLTLTELTRELAVLGGRPIRPEEQRAIAEIEQALGLASRPVLARLFARRAAPAPAPTPEPGFEVAAMARFLDGDHGPMRQRMQRLLCQPEFAYLGDAVDRRVYREQVLAWCRRLADEGFGALGLPPEHGGGGDPTGFIATFETLAFHDLSLLVKFGVQFGLFAGSILQLGTERHHQRYLRPAGRLELPGCFAMTETGHGSNVNELETTATFDPATGELVVDTPHDGAGKDYIGNAALPPRPCSGRRSRGRDRSCGRFPAARRLSNSTGCPTSIENNRKHAVSFDAILMECVGHYRQVERPAELQRHLRDMVQASSPAGTRPFLQDRLLC